jgi:4-hydroxybenzoate polyprenyltransferase
MIAWRSYWRLMRFDRPIGIYLLLWPTVWALWIAGKGHPSWIMVAVFVAGTVIMRALGCVANDWCDRKIDGHVERTKNRPIPAGEVTPRQALCCLSVLTCLAAGLAIGFLHWGTVALATIGLVLALVYPLTKRFFAYPQLVLGLAFSWGIPMAFWQLQHQLPPVAWLLLGLGWLWAFVYDTQYALVDADDDIRLGIHSSALSLGRHAHAVIRIGQLVLLLGWVALGLILNTGVLYFLACAFVLCVFIYQDKCLLKNDRAASFSAFLSNNWIGLCVFLGILVG